MTEYKNLIIGDAAHPFPMAEFGQTQDKLKLWNDQNGEIRLATCRDVNADYIYGELMRNLPTRSMLPYLGNILTANDSLRTDRNSKSYVHCFLGAPSIGKSYMFKQLSRLAHPQGCLYMNCTDIDAGSLFYETVFDTSNAQKEKDAIDAKLLQGNIDPELGLSERSKNILKTVLGADIYLEEQRDGKTIASIDWSVISSKTNDPDREIRVLDNVIKQVCKLEGIEFDNNSSSVGITTRDGLLVRALKDKNSPDYGRPVLIDEWNRCKPGSDEKLLEFFAFLADPKVSSIEVTGGNNKNFIFTRQDIPEGFMVYATGNKSREGMGEARDLSKPQISRLGKELNLKTVPDPTEGDFIDRIVQHLTGVPAMQILLADKKCTENSTYYIRILEYVRKIGLSQEQQKRIPDKEILNIKNIDNIIQVAQSVAKVMHSMYKTIAEISAEESEFNDRYKNYVKNEVLVDMRFLSLFFDQAEVLRPKFGQQSSGGFEAMLESNENERNREAEDSQNLIYGALFERGDNLEVALQNTIKNIFQPVDLESMNLSAADKERIKTGYNNIMAVAKSENFGFATNYTQANSVGKIYNLKQDDIPELKLQRVLSIIAASIARVYPDLPKLDKSQISVSQVEKYLQKVSNSKDDMVLINHNLDKVMDEPLVAAYTSENSCFASDNPVLKADDLVEMEDFLETLQLKELFEKNINSIWNSGKNSDYQDINPMDEKVYGIMSGKDKNVLTNVIRLKNNDEIASLYVYARLKPTQKVIFMTPSTVSNKIKADLANEDITIIDQNTSKADMEKHFKAFAGANKNISITDLVDATLARNYIGMSEQTMEGKDPIKHLWQAVFEYGKERDPEVSLDIVKKRVEKVKPVEVVPEKSSSTDQTHKKSGGLFGRLLGGR